MGGPSMSACLMPSSLSSLTGCSLTSQDFRSDTSTRTFRSRLSPAIMTTWPLVQLFIAAANSSGFPTGPRYGRSLKTLCMDDAEASAKDIDWFSFEIESPICRRAHSRRARLISGNARPRQAPTGPLRHGGLSDSLPGLLLLPFARRGDASERLPVDGDDLFGRGHTRVIGRAATGYGIGGHLG